MAPPDVSRKKRPLALDATDAKGPNPKARKVDQAPKFWGVLFKNHANPTKVPPKSSAKASKDPPSIPPKPSARAIEVTPPTGSTNFSHTKFGPLDVNYIFEVEENHEDLANITPKSSAGARDVAPSTGSANRVHEIGPKVRLKNEKLRQVWIKEINNEMRRSWALWVLIQKEFEEAERARGYPLAPSYADKVLHTATRRAIARGYKKAFKGIFRPEATKSAYCGRYGSPGTFFPLAPGAAIPKTLDHFHRRHRVHGDGLFFPNNRAHSLLGRLIGPPQLWHEPESCESIMEAYERSTHQPYIRTQRFNANDLKKPLVAELKKVLAARLESHATKDPGVDSEDKLRSLEVTPKSPRQRYLANRDHMQLFADKNQDSLEAEDTKRAQDVVDKASVMGDELGPQGVVSDELSSTVHEDVAHEDSVTIEKTVEALALPNPNTAAKDDVPNIPLKEGENTPVRTPIPSPKPNVTDRMTRDLAEIESKIDVQPTSNLTVSGSSSSENFVTSTGDSAKSESKTDARPTKGEEDHVHSLCGHDESSARTHRCASCGYCSECYNLYMNKDEWRICTCSKAPAQEGTQLGQGNTFTDKDTGLVYELDIRVGDRDLSTELFNSWSIPLDFPDKIMLNTRLLCLSTTSTITDPLVEEYLNQDICEDIIDKIKSLEKKEHQICLRNLHLHVCGRIFNLMKNKCQTEGGGQSKGLSKSWRGQALARNLQRHLRAIHPEVRWLDWDQIKQDIRDKKSFCKHVNSPDGCRFGNSCRFTHSLEGVPCDRDKSLKKCERGDECWYVHSILPENKKNSNKRLCPHFASSGFCTFGDSCYNDHSSYEREQDHQDRTTTAQPQNFDTQLSNPNPVTDDGSKCPVEVKTPRPSVPSAVVGSKRPRGEEDKEADARTHPTKRMRRSSAEIVQSKGHRASVHKGQRSTAHKSVNQENGLGKDLNSGSAPLTVMTNTNKQKATSSASHARNGLHDSQGPHRPKSKAATPMSTPTNYAATSPPSEAPVTTSKAKSHPGQVPKTTSAPDTNTLPEKPRAKQPPRNTLSQIRSHIAGNDGPRGGGSRTQQQPARTEPSQSATTHDAPTSASQARARKNARSSGGYRKPDRRRN